LKLQMSGNMTADVSGGKFTENSGKYRRRNLVRETIYCLTSCLGQYQCLVVEYFRWFFVDDEIKGRYTYTSLR